jgi:hypothetical protein
VSESLMRFSARGASRSGPIISAWRSHPRLARRAPIYLCGRFGDRLAAILDSSRSVAEVRKAPLVVEDADAGEME